MAKDGTNRGGARVGAGAKKKPLAEKIAEGNPGKRALTVIDFDNAVDLEGQPMPKPSAMLSATQKDGKKLIAAEVYEATWNWLAERRCTALVSPQLLEQFPKGTRVELVHMDDPYNRKLVPSCRGTVVTVDSIGTIHVAWDCGSSLGVAYGEDVCRKVADE